MAFIDDIVKFHSFSKSTVRTGLTLGEAVNPSGHTVTSKQVRTDDIPWFVNSFQGDEDKARTWAAANATDARHNDILYYGAEFKVGFTAPKCLIYVSKHEVDGKLVDLPAEQCGWQTFDLNAATTLKNADGKDVIAIHKNAKVEYVDGSNNAATNSNQQSLFVRRADGTLLDHFVAATDQIVGGQPSLGYNAVVSVSGKAIDEGEGSGNYIGNTYAGIIHFHSARTNTKANDGSVNGITVTCFEYIGDKLDTTLADIDAKISKVVGDAFEGAVASVTADTNTKNLGLTVSDGANPVITVTPGTISDAKLVTGSTVKTYVDTTALADGGSIAQKIESAINDLGDVAVKSDIKISEIKVKSGSTTTTLTPDSNKSVTVEIPEVQAATTSVAGVVTISDNDAIATTETSTAAATVAAVAATRSAITTEISTAVSGLETKLTTGDGSLGAKVAALETATGTTLPAAIEQALTDAKAYSDSLHTTSLDYVVLGDSESLPTASADTLGKIYLVASQNAPTADGSAISGSYVEYMTRKVSETEYTWEKIGTTAADLSAYAKTSDVTTAIATAKSEAIAAAKTETTTQVNALAATHATDKAALEASIATKVGEVQWFGENDLLSTKAEVKDGKLVVSEKEITNPNGIYGAYAWNTNVAKVVNNEAFNADGEKIATIETDKLKNGASMFYNVNISEFASDMPLIEDGVYMFTDTGLTQFVGDLPSLTTASKMFERSDIVEFIGDLSSLTNGSYMFIYCNALTTFISDLSSLTDGINMFYDTNLSLESVECIADTINEYNGVISISWATLPAESERQALVDALSRIVDKGWKVRTDSQLHSLFDSERYQIVSSQVQPLDLESEPQTVYYVVKK